MKIIIYLVIPLYMGLLYLLSSEEELPDDLKHTGIQRAYDKIGAFIYRRFLSENKFFLRSLSKRRVNEYLKTLHSKPNVKAELKSYYIQKISIVLMIVTLGAVLALISSISAKRNTDFDEENKMIRPDYKESSETRYVEAKGINGIDYGDFDFEVSAQSYTRSEAEALYKEMSEELSWIILSENESLSCVESDLKLVESVPGYPFKIEWQSGDIDIIHSDGRVEAESVPKAGQVVMLTANIRYLDMHWEKVFEAKVFPKNFTEYEHMRKSIREKLLHSEESTREDKSFSLPSDAEGTELIWKEKVEDNSLLLMLFVVMAAGLIYVSKDKELSKEVEDRRRSMMMEYPQFISRLVLYMGAGMSVRGIFRLFSAEYQKDLKLGGKRSFLYEEIHRSCNEMESGVPELSAYERLAVRCGAQQYTRLVTLLSQNLKKGNSELLDLLYEESDKATDERMSYARKLGEEAGTKLLVPMVMMLLIVMVVVVIPAYLSF